MRVSEGCPRARYVYAMVDSPELFQCPAVVGSVVVQRPEGVTQASAADALEGVTRKVLRDVDFRAGRYDLVPQHGDELQEERVMRIARSHRP